MTGNPNKIFDCNILQWNAQSVKLKCQELEQLLTQEKIHITLISESWLKYDTDIRINGYNIFRKDRPDGYGGVAIVSHKSIKIFENPVQLKNSSIEVIHVVVSNCRKLRNIILIYCPPSINTAQSDWDDIFSKFPRNCLIAGDFNAHHSIWSNRTDNKGILVNDAALEYGFVCVNSGQATRIKLVNNILQTSSPDIAFVSSDIAVNFDFKTLNENLGSDHLCIKLNYRFSGTKQFVKKRNIKLADWDEYKKYLRSNWSVPDSLSEVEVMYNSLVTQINTAADKFIPYIKICQNPTSNFTPKRYWNSELSRLVACRRLALSKFRKNPTPENLNRFEKAIREFKTEIRKAKFDDWQLHCSSIDNSSTATEMWNKLRWIKGIRKSSYIVSQERNEELLCSLAPDYVQVKCPSLTSSNADMEAEFTYPELCNILKKNDTAPGIDEITYSMIYYSPYICKCYILKI